MEEEGKCDGEETGNFPSFPLSVSISSSSEETEKLILPSYDLGHVRGQRGSRPDSPDGGTCC